MGIEFWVSTPMTGSGIMAAVATLPEVVGAYPDFARLVREITGSVASRVAARRAGISHDTIIRMWQGDRVSQPIILRFALGYRIDPNPLLEAAGYPAIEDMNFTRLPIPKVESERRALYTSDAIRDAIDEGADEEQFERIREPGAEEEEAELKLRMMAAYDKLPFKIKQIMAEQAEATADAMYSARTDIVGKKADRLVDTPEEK